jgi:hypothetical protein
MEADLVKRSGIQYTEIPSGQVAGMVKERRCAREIIEEITGDAEKLIGGFRFE